MKKSLTSFISALSKDNMEAFEDIIINKYRKFRKFYEILKDYSDDIKSLDYEFTDKRSLSVVICFNKDVCIKKEEIIEQIKKDGYDVDKSKVKNKKMKLVIRYDE